MNRMSRVEIAAALITAGLAVQIATIWWSHPLSAIAFLGVGALAVVAGATLALASLWATSTDGPSRAPSATSADGRKTSFPRRVRDA